MKKSFLKFYYILSLVSISLILGSESYSETTTITLKNPLDIARPNEVIKINAGLLKKKSPDFNLNRFSVFYNNDEIPYDWTYNENTGVRNVLILLSFKPNETKEIVFTDSIEGEKPTRRTEAYLGEKKDYEKKDGYYTGGHFESTDLAKVPADHFAHDALYQFEGPGWESEKIGYRLYLDERNRTDIFGKRVNGLFLNNIGKNDLVSDGDESYQSLLEWGRDIFKVGNSLGIGSIATFYQDKVTTVSDVDSIFCLVSNAGLFSEVRTIHFGWKLDKKINVKTMYSIYAGSRNTEVNATINKNIENLCTGLAKHENTDFFTSDKSGWNYIALWGKQTLEDDNLGIAVFYNKDDLVKISEDELSHFVILKPDNNRLTYYFTAAWEQEPAGIKSKSAFINFLENETARLSSPVKILFE